MTRYELQLAAGTKVSRVSQLRDDLAYALATTEIRILAPIPGKQAVGVEVPNSSANLVTLGDIFQDAPAGASPLTAWLGKDISGAGVACDLARMPHLLIAGTTGSGKSGCINAILASILLRATPDQVRMILVDPKRVELNHYESIPHLLTPVVTNMKNAALVLQNIVREMDSRYELMGAAKARNLSEWNAARAVRGQDPIPYVLVVIDELADLMMVSPAEVEDTIIRLAQKSRAVGIHLVLATQSPRGRRDHRHDQGQRAVADRLRGLVADGLARDPRHERRRGAPGRGGHALQAARDVQAPARAGRVHLRGRDRADRDGVPPAGRAVVRGGAAGDDPPRAPTRGRSTPTTIPCSRMRSGSSRSTRPPPSRCSSAASAWATPAPAG